MDVAKVTNTTYHLDLTEEEMLLIDEALGVTILAYHGSYPDKPRESKKLMLLRDEVEDALASP